MVHRRMNDKSCCAMPAALKEALELTACSAAPSAELQRTLEKSLTRRAVLWLGQTCNLKCEFCYFIERVADRNHPEHAFMSLEKAQKICETVAGFYGNTSIDIQGGEPTLYREIFELIQICNRLGLAPTLITNALLLDDIELCRKYQDAGVRDFLISVQGLGKVHDRIVGCSGAHRRQMVALRNLQEVGIPFRFNVVMSKPALAQLPEIAEFAVRTGAFVVNFITFNPFADQATDGKRSDCNVPRYSDVKPHLTQALDLLEKAGVEANVRYFPFCMVEERHRKSVYNFQQLSYDPHEWDFASWGWTGLQPQRIADGEPSPPVSLSAGRRMLRHKEIWKKLAENRCLRPILYQGHRLLSHLSAMGSSRSREDLYREVARIHAQLHCRYTYGEKCSSCLIASICDGFHSDYAQLYGTDEASPLLGGGRSTDQLFYITKQEKSLLLDSLSSR